MKKIISLMIAVAVLVTCLGALVGCENDPLFKYESKEPAKNMVISAVSPEEGEHFTLVNENIQDFVENYKLAYSQKYFAYGEDKFTGNETVKLEWTYNGEDKPDYYIVTYATNVELSDAVRVMTFGTQIDIVNLFVNSRYFWQVTAVFGDHTVKSSIFTFYTEDTPRIVIIDGVSNTRDIGGLLTEDGRRLKQGMVYRSGYLTNVTTAGKAQATGDLGIKTELDLLETSSGSSRFGKSVNYINISGYYYGNFRDSGNWRKLANEFKVFADADNYPILFHCAAGRDRTGCLAATLEALCGVPEETIYKDYELSFFSKVGSGDKSAGDTFVKDTMLPQFTAVLEMIKSYAEFIDVENPTLAQCTEKFLLAVGLTQEEIDATRDNMIEK